MNLRLAAGASQTQTYILYPLVCGFVNLPKLRLVAYPDSTLARPLDALLESALPHFIQIMVSSVACPPLAYTSASSLENRSRKAREPEAQLHSRAASGCQVGAAGTGDCVKSLLVYVKTFICADNEE